MTAFHAARVAAAIKRKLGLDVVKEHGPYGQFEVRVDGEQVVDGGSLALLGVLPGVNEVVEKVRARLGT